MNILFLTLTLLLFPFISSHNPAFQLLPLRNARLSTPTSIFAIMRGGMRDDENSQDVRGGTARQLTSQQVKESVLFSRNNSFRCNDNKTSYVEYGKWGGKQCNFSLQHYCQPTTTFLNLEQNFQDIYPGSILMSQFLNGVLDGTESPVPLSQGSSYKQPTISIYDNLQVQSFTSDYSILQINIKMAQKIRANLNKNANNTTTVYCEVGTSDDLQSFAERISISKAVLKKIGLFRPPGQPLTSFKKKIIFSFIKPIAIFDVAIASNSTPLSTFYTSELPSDTFDLLTDPPVYVDSVTYGSLLLLVVDYNEVTSSLLHKLEDSSLISPSSAQPILNAIISQPSLKVFTAGSFSEAELRAIKSSNWLQMFIALPSKLTNSIHPLAYSVRNFRQQRYYAASQFEYVKICY